ncbi:glycerol-3-phosphate acyltransferase 4 isoform X2 [Phlebotomus argentipes]|uniref:glycerol-3-phosphate acyltransferase 4 isoform X2 n=1 Tax=Phlebotomus argentipes TaxID=94469 RepID=UPI0028935690|nr:glycerol-3-phosphate acyltransferase 4 isoform X2 [Phlebotomus argentipes]
MAFFQVFVLSIIIVGSLGKSFGIRRLYVNFLLKIFEYGRVNIETAKKSRYDDVSAETDDEASLTSQTSIAAAEPGQKVMVNGNGFLGKPQPNGNHLISRDPLILAPDAEYQSTKKEPPRKISSSSDEFNAEEEKNFEFNLENCLDYVKAGMEAIIEDDVTSRFEAEELKNWNLLTRTNRHYEFISWRLTVIWMCGFFIRYIVLMPLRVLICFFGVAWAVVSFAIIGCIPMRRLRRRLNDEAFKITFRLISNSISAVITFHNPEFRPRNCGFCVANHTSPIDISILSTDCTYSLVMWLVICTALVGSLPDNDFKRWMVPPILRHCFSILASSVSTVITYHNEENRPLNGICVANHTTPIDALVLMHDNCYSLMNLVCDEWHSGFDWMATEREIKNKPFCQGYFFCTFYFPQHFTLPIILWSFTGFHFHPFFHSNVLSVLHTYIFSFWASVLFLCLYFPLFACNTSLVLLNCCYNCVLTGWKHFAGCLVVVCVVLNLRMYIMTN